MAGKFPGMDPYLEAQGNWPDFHNNLISEIRNSLGLRLPDGYVARSDERVEVAGFEEPASASFVPDILIAKSPGDSVPQATGSFTATCEPITVEVMDSRAEEYKHTWVEIRRAPDFELVTVIEVLSPANKSGLGSLEYARKRDELHSQGVNLVEIDLLLGGKRPAMKPALSVGHYLAIVARGDRLPKAELYRWSVRDRLPVLPIPLKAPEADVAIDLQEMVTRVYDLGRYAMTLRHRQPLPASMPLHPEDRAWVEAVGQAS